MPVLVSWGCGQPETGAGCRDLGCLRAVCSLADYSVFWWLKFLYLQHVEPAAGSVSAAAE